MRPADDLPRDVAGLVPHRPPLCLLQRLLEAEGGQGCAEAWVAADSPLVDRDGVLDEAALVEMMAQACAAVRGSEARRRGEAPRQGYLVGASAVRIAGRARSGDHLQVRVRPVNAFGDFLVVDGEVRRGGDLLACGRLNLWLAPPEPPGALSA
jgi:predicted hotdog family 3-hydroxylacyl-ACP dehydratase